MNRGLVQLGGVLIGRRDAIVSAARNPGTIWAGAFFVLAAGLARDYDGADLLRKPWLLLIPYAASIAVSFLVYVVTFTSTGEPTQSFWREYRMFLGVFWLTAPMALLYAIPYERFLSPAGAMGANLYTLALVAFWRVLVTTRIVSVLTTRSLIGSFFLVMLIADGVALLALTLMPAPVIQFMGGVRLSEPEVILASLKFNGILLTIFSSPLWIIGVIAARYYSPTRTSNNQLLAQRTTGNDLMIAAIACVGMFLLLLPFTQPEQRRAARVDELLRSSEIVGALTEMSAYQRSQYPPAWDPPPHFGWGEEEVPPLKQIINRLEHQDSAPWVRAMFIEKMERAWISEGMIHQQEELSEYGAIIDRLPEAAEIRLRNKDMLDRLEVYRRMLESDRAATRPSTFPTTVPQ